MIDHQSSYYDENLNRSYDSIRLILFYKDSIKSGPIYSIDNRNTQSSLRLAKHFASETFHSRLSIEDNLDPNSTASGHATRGKHPLKVKVELVGEQSLADSSIESGSKNGQSSNLVPSAGSPSTGIQLGPGFNVPLETPHHYHHYQQQLELEKQQQHSIDHNLDTIYLRIDGLKATDSGEYSSIESMLVGFDFPLEILKTSCTGFCASREHPTLTPNLFTFLRRVQMSCGPTKRPHIDNSYKPESDR